MRYDYACRKCSSSWEERHGMNERPVIKCKKCGEIAYRAFNTVPESYIRGYGWLDRKGAHRDMNHYKLMNDDPYARYREPGEKDELATKLKKSGKHTTNPKRFNISNLPKK